LSRDQIDVLFARVRDGDRRAVEPAFEALCPIVRRYCLKLLGDATDADDAMQASLIKMFEQAPDYDPNRSAVGWALAFAYWECRTLRKTSERQNRRDGGLLAEKQIPGLSDPETDLSQAELEALATRLLGALPPEDLALLGNDDGDYRMSLEGALQDLSNSARRKRKQRIVARLRQAFLEILSPASAHRGEAER
jgi:DNA-directed RNA polymerase specialized sigma24 family protein